MNLPDPKLLNLWISMVILVIGFFFLFDQRGPRKALGPACMKWAFSIWLAYWALAVIVYFLFQYYRDSPDWLKLFALDFRSVLLIAFSVVYMLGDDLLPTENGRKNLQLVFKLAQMIFGILAVCFIFALGGERLGARQEMIPATIQVAPSVLLSGIANLLMGWAFMVRYGSLTALVLLFLTFFYALAQLPAYLSGTVLAKAHGIDVVFFFLAWMKVVIAALCFAFFASPFWRVPENLSLRTGTPPTRIDQAGIWPPSGKDMVRLSSNLTKALAVLASAGGVALVAQLIEELITFLGEPPACM